MNYCYLCNNVINGKNRTREHILPQSIGGKLKSDLLICKVCNSELGREIDAELSKLLLPFASKLNIPRDKGNPPNILAKAIDSQDELVISSGNVARFHGAKIEENEETITITAGTRKRLIQEIRKLKKQHPKMDIEKAISSAERINEGKTRFEFTISADIEKIFRAVSKIACNYYILKGGNPDCIEKVIEYIKGNNENHYVSFFDLTHQYFQGEKKVLHIIAIVGRTVDHILYAYVELFNALKFLVLLSDDYSGPDITESHCLNVLERKEEEKKIILNIAKQDVLMILQLKPPVKKNFKF